MKGYKRAAVIVSLVESLRERGSWCGETHIQKTLFFLQEVLSVPLELEFIPYKHGPYCFNLTQELISLRADSILKLESQQESYGPSIVLGELSDNLKSRFPQTIQKYEPEINFIAEQLGSKRVKDLERYSTALYVTKQGLGTSIKERAQNVVVMKPHISMEDAKDAVKFVDGMKKEAKKKLKDLAVE